MPRPLRVEYAGAWYHLMNRGRRREEIFFEEKDYELFLGLLGECRRLFMLEIHAYSLMPNHYHLLAHTPNGNLSKAMKHLDGVYTQKINRKYNLEGSLFKGRFKSIIVQKNSNYLVELVRYIHRNPIKARLEKVVGEHAFTSHKAYINDHAGPKWLIRDRILKIFSRYRKEAKRKLHAFVKKDTSPDLEKTLDSLKWPAVLGGEKFKGMIKENILGKEIITKELPQYNDLTKKIDLPCLLDKLCADLNIPKLLFSKKNAKGESNNLRKAFAYICKTRLGLPNKEIANALGGITKSAVSKLYAMALEDFRKNGNLCKIIKRMDSIIDSTFLV